MKPQRRGSNLKTQIAMALHYLCRDQIDLKGKTIAELEKLNRSLTAKVKVEKSRRENNNCF